MVGSSLGFIYHVSYSNAVWSLTLTQPVPLILKSEPISTSDYITIVYTAAVGYCFPFSPDIFPF